MSIELSLRKGTQRAIRKIKSIKEKPILVAIYGWPNSGKSYLIDRFARYFEERGLSVGRSTGGPHPSTFERLRDLGSESLKEILLFHCGWERDNLQYNGKLILKNEDPNYLVESIVRKNIHLNIGIYNPKFYRKPRGDYDFVIINPFSKEK
ncbi:MAG: hypothetical protein KKF67_02130 [Nanoarchaeota archaeon]|nr:hypothetical protein [Nanoarchaeota archaeon]